MQHLKSLREAGLTHIHLLPAYDFGSVPERREDQATVKVSTRAHASSAAGTSRQHTRASNHEAHADLSLLVELTLHARACWGRLISKLALVSFTIGSRDNWLLTVYSNTPSANSCTELASRSH